MVILALIHASESNLGIFHHARFVIIRYLSVCQAMFTKHSKNMFARISRNVPTRAIFSSEECHSNRCPISLMVVFRANIAVTGVGELGFDSGEGA